MIERRSGTVELRDSGKRLHGVILTEGRAATGGRRELFVLGAARWGQQGVGILTRHRARPEVFAVPTREPDGRLRIEARATDPIRRAVEVGRRDMSIEFVSLKERQTRGGVREIHDALILRAALVPAGEYGEGLTGAEVRQGGALTLVQGPVASGKSQELDRLKAAGEIDVAADLTSLWAATGLHKRGPSGKYPTRTGDDPSLQLGRILKTVAVRQGLQNGMRVAVTTSVRGEEDRWRLEAEEHGAPFEVVTVDPGEDVIRERLAGAGGVIEEECEVAFSRWYGSGREALAVPESPDSGRGKGPVREERRSRGHTGRFRVYL